MPLEIITEGILGSIVRFIVWCIVDIFLEILVRGLGYLLCKPFKKVDIDSLASLIVGIIAWIVIGTSIYYFATAISHQLAIDSCLDSGGKFDYAEEQCIH